jgi:hypothetical protein
MTFDAGEVTVFGSRKSSSTVPAPQWSTNARHVEILLTYDGQDMTQNIAPYLTSFRYVDRTIKDQMDELAITVQDVAGLWKGSWWPAQGSKFAAKIQAFNWFTAGDALVRDCGSFEIDDLTSTGPPNIMTLSAVSVGITASIRRQENTKAWENITCNAIAQDIATRNGFRLFFDSSYNPIYDRFDQRAESDLAFLQRVCEYTGLSLKVTSDTIVIFRGEDYDAKDPILTVMIGQDGYMGHSFNANSCDVYSACEVKYYHPGHKELLTYLYKPDGISGTRKAKKEKGAKGGGGWSTAIDPNTRLPLGAFGASSTQAQIPEPKIGQVLKVNQRCGSLAQAEQVAKAALRDKNLRQTKGTLRFMGHPVLYSGANIAVSGFGRWDSAIWAVEEITHSYAKNSGYTTELQLRGTLAGY